MSEPASDLAVAMTVISSLTEREIKAGTAFVGEVGLGGELRHARGVAQRVKEAAKLGFSTILVPKASVRGLGDAGKLGLPAGTSIVGCADLTEAMSKALARRARDGAQKAEAPVYRPPPAVAGAPSSYDVAEGDDGYSSPALYERRAVPGEKDGHEEEEEEKEEEEDRAQFRVPQFYSPGEDLRVEDAQAARRAAKYRRSYKKKR